MCYVIYYYYYYYYTIYLSIFKAGFLYVALTVLELSLLARLAPNSEIRLPLLPACWD